MVGGDNELLLCHQTLNQERLKAFQSELVSALSAEVCDDENIRL